MFIYVIGSDFCYVERTNINLIEELERAFDVLKIEESRRNYDQELNKWQENQTYLNKAQEIEEKMRINMVNDTSYE